MKKTNIYFIGVPKVFEEEIAQIVEQSIGSIRHILAYEKPIGVAIFEAQSQYVIPEIGLAGSAIGKSGIEIRIDFQNKFTKKKIGIELFSSVCHEATHLVRESSVGYNAHLRDAMINEGVACYVEQQFFPNRPIPYIAPIKNEKAFLEKAKASFEKKTDYSDWLFGSKTLPRWIGYRLGYLMVNECAKNNKISLSQLVRMRSGDISKKSGII